MKKTYIYYLLFLNLCIAANPIEEINSFFKNDLIFIQTSLNNIDDSFDKSVGSFKRDSNNRIKIDVESPFKEIYFIDSNGIEIHDLEFNQIKTIPTKQLKKSFFVNFVLNGLIDNTKIIDINNESFVVLEDEKRYYFEFIDQNNLQIKFKDNMNIDNLIKFSKTNAS